MTDFLSNSENEQNIAAIKDVINRYSETGKMNKIDASQLREVLKPCGAEFNGLTEGDHASLKKYTNEGKAEGMKAVWGDTHPDFRKWTKFMAQWYEARGIMLPKLPKSGVKNSGMMGFLCDITAFAANDMSFDRFKEVSEARWEVGRIVRDGERKRTERPTIAIQGKDEHVPSGILPDFPLKAFVEILNLQERQPHD